MIGGQLLGGGMLAIGWLGPCASVDWFLEHWEGLWVQLTAESV